MDLKTYKEKLCVTLSQKHFSILHLHVFIILKLFSLLKFCMIFNTLISVRIRFLIKRSMLIIDLIKINSPSVGRSDSRCARPRNSGEK